MLHIVRHGRTEMNASGKLLGRLNPELDDVGVQQAESLAKSFKKVDILISSPLLRPYQTAEAFGVPIETDERWIEMDYGELDGVPLNEVDAQTWSQWRADLDWAPKGGESHRQLGIRIREACEDLIPLITEKEIVVVSHVSPIKAALAWALNVGDQIAWRSYVSPASVMTIGPGPSLRAFNDISHL